MAFFFSGGAETNAALNSDGLEPQAIPHSSPCPEEQKQKLFDDGKIRGYPTKYKNRKVLSPTFTVGR